MCDWYSSRHRMTSLRSALSDFTGCASRAASTATKACGATERMESTPWNEPLTRRSYAAAREGARKSAAFLRFLTLLAPQRDLRLGLQPVLLFLSGRESALLGTVVGVLGDFAPLRLLRLVEAPRRAGIAGARHVVALRLAAVG